jgi:hypothetical protein
MNIPGEVSAREDGLPVAEGDVRLLEFPRLVNPMEGLHLSEMEEMMRDIRPAEMALNGRYISHVPNGAAYELIEVPDHAKTRKASRHEVIFGQLLVDGDFGELAAQVAVKPLPDSVAGREYVVSDYIHSGNLPGCDTFPPLGIMRGFDGQAALVTEYKQSVKSSDNILWNPNHIHNRLVVNAVLGRAGVALATFHGNGWVHGDPSAKNSVANWLKSRRELSEAQDRDEYFYNDLEDAQPIAHLSEDEQHAKKLLDVDIFVWSAFRLKRSGHRLPEDYPEQLREHFGLVYVGAQNGDASHNGALTMDEISHIVYAEAENQNAGFPIYDPKRPDKA